jgi:hypothetical protein
MRQHCAPYIVCGNSRDRHVVAEGLRDLHGLAERGQRRRPQPGFSLRDTDGHERADPVAPIIDELRRLGRPLRFARPATAPRPAYAVLPRGPRQGRHARPRGFHARPCLRAGAHLQLAIANVRVLLDPARDGSFDPLSPSILLLKLRCNAGWLEFANWPVRRSQVNGGSE